MNSMSPGAPHFWIGIGFKNSSEESGQKGILAGPSQRIQDDMQKGDHGKTLGGKGDQGVNIPVGCRLWDLRRNLQKSVADLLSEGGRMQKRTGWKPRVELK